MSSCNGGENEEATTTYANRHIAAFLEVRMVDDMPAELNETGVDDTQSKTRRFSCRVQVIQDGSTLTAENLQHPNNPYGFSMQQPMLVTDSPESIGIQLPPEKHFCVRDVAEIIGPRTPVRVIDVGMQQELEGWSLQDLVDYFDDEERLRCVSQKIVSETPQAPRRKRRAAIRSTQRQNALTVLNQISLEFSQTPLRSKVQSPQFVRDLDWIDNAWPEQYKRTGHYPAVQFYCLTSAAGSFTDFHIDFGGTSVWYSILSGQKQFCLIPPTAANLKAYEEWLCLQTQAEVFLPSMLPDPSEAFRVTLQERQTLIIPSGWIHAVYTAKDSLVFGGNFLHGLDILTQIEVYKIETKNRVLDEYRFPYFIEMHFCIANDWLKRINAKGRPLPLQEWQSIPALCKVLQLWWEMKRSDPSQSNVPTVPVLVQDMLREAQMDSLEEVIEKLLHAHENGHDRHLAYATVPISSRDDAGKPHSVVNPCLAASHQEFTLSQSSPISHVATKEVPKFHIQLSAKSLQVGNSRSTEPREGLTSFPHEINDDEWVPVKSTSSSIHKKRVNKKGRASSSAPSTSAPKKKKAKNATILSARERLLKKVM